MSTSDFSNKKPIPSPCISVCALDEDDVCIGCYRTGLEISYWGKYSDQEKLEILKKANERQAG